MSSAADKSTIRRPFIHHVHELQKRSVWIALAVIAGSVAAYSVNEWLLAIVQKPLGQTLYYTSPMGGFSFLFKLCLVAGLVLALPIILYQIFAFLGPLLRRKHRLTILAYALWSFDLAYIGLLFAYFISLPSALHFLSQFGGEGIQSLITVDEYFSFALAYLAGFAALFQIPLIILFINKIKPLKPSKMMGVQKYVILFSFIGAAILTPTPDPVNQAIMAVPAIALYQIGVILIWLANKQTRKQKRLAARAAHKAKVSHKKQQPTLRPVEAPAKKQQLQPVLALQSRPVVTATPLPVVQPLRFSGRRMMDVIPPVQANRPRQTEQQRVVDPMLSPSPSAA